MSKKHAQAGTDVVMLLDPVTGWLVNALGEAGVKLICGSADERALRTATAAAIETVIERAQPSSRQALRQGLSLCFAGPPVVRIDTRASAQEGIRAAITVQIAQLSGMTSEAGVPFFVDAGVDEDWLAHEVTEAFISALRQVVAAGRTSGLVNALQMDELKGMIANLHHQIGGLRPPPVPQATRTLPPDITGFTGRNAELRELAAAMEGTAGPVGVVDIHAIDGMAGVGKTTFAIHVAHRLADRFPDGQLFLPLHGHTPGQQPVTPAEALARLLLIRGMTAQQIPEGEDARTALWRDHLVGKRVLLLLDDALDSDQVRPLLPASEDSLVLITSRRALTGLTQATPLSLDVLPADQAAVMFTRLARRPGLHPRDSGVARVIRLCGYLPLAIGLMAGRLRHKPPSWDATRLADDLEEAQDRLGEMRADNGSVAAAFDRSYQGLIPGRQHLFRCLGLHPGADFDAYAAAALTGVALSNARRGLDSLCDQNLLRESTAPGRYSFHDLIRHHARGLAALDEISDQHAAVNRLLDYYQHTAAQAGRHFTRRPIPDPVYSASAPAWSPQFSSRDEALKWLDAERANLSAAVRYAASLPSPHAVALSAVVASYLRIHGDWKDASSLQQLSSNTARTLDDCHGEGNALNELGILQRLMGKPEAADSHRRALRIYEELGDRLGQANALTNLGVVQWLTGEHAVAVTCQLRALHLYRDVADRLGQANALNYLGIVQRLMGEHADAATSLRLALQLYEELGNDHGTANALNKLGAVQRLIGEYDAAFSSQQQALALSRELGNQHGVANALNEFGIIDRLTGEYAAAATCHLEALALYRVLGSRNGQANALNYLGQAQRLLGNPTTAASSQRQALQLYRDVGDRLGQAEVLNNLGDLDLTCGHQTDACYERALRISREIRASLEEARALEGIGHRYLRVDRFQDGVSRLDQALAIYRRLDSPNAQRVEEAFRGLGGA